MVKGAEICLDRQAGMARLRAEAERMDALRVGAAVPAVCGEDIAPSVARGAFRVFEPVEMVPGSAFRHRSAGYRGRHALACADVFDRIEASARRWHARRGLDAPFAPPFSPGQVAVARRYRALVEHQAGGGVRGSLASLDPVGGGDGRGGGFLDAWVAGGQELRGLRKRMLAGAGLVVLSPARQRGRDNARRAVMLPQLVDQVCLQDRDLSDVLRAHGWAAGKTLHLRALRDALRGALDRMQGY